MTRWADFKSSYTMNADLGVGGAVPLASQRSKGRRTTQIYEVVPGAPEVPLPTIPSFDSRVFRESLGIRDGRMAKWIVNFALRLIGYPQFQKSLPETIEDRLRFTNLRQNLYAPVQSATIAIEDEPREVAPLFRAAALILGTKQFHDDIRSGAFVPDQDKGYSVEVGQYLNLFGTSVTVLDGKVQLFKSAVTNQVLVVAQRQMYLLEIPETATLGAIVDALRRLWAASSGDGAIRNEPAIGLLSCGSNPTQIAITRQLSADPLNAASFAKLRERLITICLDLPFEPRSSAEAASLAHSGNCSNRWYQSSLQFVIFGNARACAICSFSAYIDGTVMARGVAEIQRKARRLRDTRWEPGADCQLEVEHLHWNIPPRALDAADADLRSVLDNQQATFVFNGAGLRRFKEAGLDAVPAFVVALQLAFYRLTGKIIPIGQMLTMSKFRCMDVTIAISTTTDVIKLVREFEQVRSDGIRIAGLLQSAIESQRRAWRKVRKHIPAHRLIALFRSPQTGFRRWYVAQVFKAAWAALAALGLLKTEGYDILISHPKMYNEVSLLGRPGARLPYVRQFGLHYQILSESITATFMPSTKWRIPNVEVAAELERSINDVLVAGEHLPAHPVGLVSQVEN